MEQCKDCLRNEPGACPVFKEINKPNPCWARITDREQYIKEQREIMAYNESRCEQAYKLAYKNIRRVTKGASD